MDVKVHECHNGFHAGMFAVLIDLEVKAYFDAKEDAELFKHAKEQEQMLIYSFGAPTVVFANREIAAMASLRPLPKPDMILKSE